LEVLPSAVRFVLAFSLLSWIPGWIVTGRFLRPAVGGPAEKTVVGFTAGLAGLSLLTWPAKLAGVTFGAYSVVVQWALAVFFAVALVVDARTRAAGRRQQPDEEAPAGRMSAPVQSALLAVSVVLALVSLGQPPFLDYRQDSLDHIGYVRHIGSENSLTPGGVLAPPEDADARAVKEDPRKGTFHPVVALAARMSAVDPIDAWRTLPAVFFPLAFLAFTWFCACFLPKRGLVWGCAVLFLLFQGGTGVLHGMEFANGQAIWLVFFWTLVPMCLRCVSPSGERRRNLATTLAVFAGGALMHIGVLTHVAVVMATLLLFHRWLGLAAGAVVRLCAWGGAVAVVVLGWKVATSIGAGNEIHVHPQGLLYVGSRMFVASPVEVLRQNGLVFFGGLVLVPFLLFAARGHPSVRLQLSFAVIPFVVCFFPPLATPLYDLAAYMVFRTIVNVPAFAVVATAVYLLTVWSRRRGWAARVVAAVILLVWSKLFLVPAAAAFSRAREDRNVRREAPALFERYADLIAFMTNRPGGSVVLSDPKTGYLLSAATDHRFVAVLEQHGNPNDPYAFDRMEAIRDVLSPFTYLSQAVAACERYGVDFVVVNGRLRDDGIPLLSVWSPALLDQARVKLGALAERFRPMYETDDLSVYLYYPGPVPADQWTPEGTPPLFGVIDLHKCTVRAPGDVFYISEAGVSPEVVLPGETVEITLGYEMPQGVSYGLPYVVHIRFDHHRIAIEGDGYFLDKQVRRFRERRGGYRLRHRVDHRPFGGLFPIDQWPAAVLFYETIPVKLPPTMEPGPYVVEFSIGRESLLPNFVLRDFLYNRDHYSGLECLSIEVTKQRVR
jgi:hypothetical protein